LHYPNVWPQVPDFHIPTFFGPVGIGDASNGLCGGMAFVVRDLFEAKRTPPLSHQNPVPGSPAFDFIVARLFDSFNLPLGVMQYLEWMQLNTHNTWIGPTGTSWRTINDHMPILRGAIDSGHPCPISLVCVHSPDPMLLGHNHQVLAYAYDDIGPDTTVHVYDSNYPDTDVTITFNHTNPYNTTTFNYSAGNRTVLGFFVTPYAPKDPSPLFQDGNPAIGITSPVSTAAVSGDPVVNGTVTVTIRAPQANSIDISAYCASDVNDASTLAWRRLGWATSQGGGMFTYQLDTTTIPDQDVKLDAAPVYGGAVAPVAPASQHFSAVVRVQNLTMAPRVPIVLPAQPAPVILGPLDVDIDDVRRRPVTPR
jgi:hypothetical protein